MFIRQKVSPHNPDKISIQIVESIRFGDKVSQKIRRHVGVALNKDELEQLLSLAESIKKKLEDDLPHTLPLFSPEEFAELNNTSEINHDSQQVDPAMLFEEQRTIIGIGDVFGRLYDDLEFNKIFQGRFARIRNSILKSCVLARIANPSSKLRTAELLEEDFAVSLSVEQIYRMMDQLDPLSERVKNFVRNSTLNVYSGKINVLFYDVTTLYFESLEQDEIRNFGFSKDSKFKEVQMVVAFVTTTKGLPITYEVFPGNTQEIKTLLPTLQQLRAAYDIKDVEFVADRGMFSKENLDLLEQEQIYFIVAAKLRTMSKEMKEKILKIKENNPDNEFRVLEIEYQDKKLIVSYSPQRAQKDRKDRDRLLDRVSKIVDKNGEILVSKLIKNSGSKKYLQFENKKGNRETAHLNEDKIAEDTLWDGIHGLIINSKTLSAQEAIEKYKNLWQIEETFRINKHDLKIRPIFHHKTERIRSHMLICFLSYALARQLMYRMEIQQKERVSFECIRNALLHTQSSVLYDTQTKKRYLMPSRISPLAKRIYKAVGVKHLHTCRQI